RRVQLVEHHAWLDPGPALLRVDFKNAIEIFRRVDLQPLADGLTCLRRPTAPHRQRTAMSAADLNGLDDVLARFHDNDTDRLDLIDARVGGVQRAGDRVKADLALELSLQIATQGMR